MKLTRISGAVALFCSLAAQAAPDTEGSWTGVVNWSLVAQHAVLTPQGKVLTWGTDSVGDNSSEFFYDVWNPASGTGAASHNTLFNSVGVDSFCSAGLLSPVTGDVLMFGGDARPQGSTNGGVSNVLKYSSSRNNVTPVASMASARWYPTTVTLPNGEILTVGGRDVARKHSVTPEVYNPGTNRWRSLFGAPTTKYNFWYPRLWVIPDGRVFGYQKHENSGAEGMFYINTTGSGSLSEVGIVQPAINSNNGSTAVMYRPGKILVLTPRTNADRSKTRAIHIDVTGANPVVTEVGQPSQTVGGRVWANSIVLPDGKVMLVGGSGSPNKLEKVAYSPEIWDPSTRVWTTMKSHKQARLYHSVALLLKDGRVMVGGGGSPGPQLNLNSEIFSPPYLHKGARPRITGAPAQASYGSGINVSHPNADRITRVTLVKTGAVTHSFNMDQRFIELGFSDTASGVRVNIPSSRNVATPGFYLMFLINDKGVPSVGHTIRIGAGTVSNVAPVGRPDNANASSRRIIIDALANDTGTGLTLAAPSAYSQRGGRVSLSSNKIAYTARPGFNGTDKIWYTAKDSRGRGVWSVVTITVSGNAAANPFPVARPDTYSATAGAAKTLDVLSNDVGTGRVLNALNAWSQKGGNVALVSNKIRYTAKSSFSGQDKIFYSFKDVQNRSAWGTATINVSGGTGASNPAPVGRPDTYSAKAGVAKTLDVLANDVGNGRRLNAPSLWSQKGGRVALVNNRLRYTAKAGFSGQDKIFYSFKDVANRQSWSTVTINVSR